MNVGIIVVLLLKFKCLYLHNIKYQDLIIGHQIKMMLFAPIIIESLSLFHKKNELPRGRAIEASIRRK